MEWEILFADLPVLTYPLQDFLALSKNYQFLFLKVLLIPSNNYSFYFALKKTLLDH